MKKNVKKVLATVVVAGMGVASLAGCTATPKTSSMTDVMNVASELDSYSYSYKYSMTTDGETMEFELYGNCTKDAMSVSVKVEADEMDYDAKDIAIATKDALYINLAEIEDEFLAEMDLGTYGLDADWIKLDYGMELEVTDATASFGTMFEAVEEAYGDMIEEEDGEYVLVVDDNETAKEFLELTADMIDENQADWADVLVSSYDSFDYETFITNFMNNLFMEINRTFDLGLTSADIKSAVEDAVADIDFEELESEMDATYYTDMFTELSEEIRLMAEEVDIEESNGEIELKAFQDGKEYVTSFKMSYETDYEDVELECESTIVAEKVEVSVPTKDVMSVEEAICVLIETFSGDIYADDAEELIEEVMDSMGDVDLSGMSGALSPDVDYDDWYDDEYWDEEW